MSLLFPGSRVPNRKPMPNPHTVSGSPRWNTYAALGCQPVSYDASSFVVKKGDASPTYSGRHYTQGRKKGGGRKKKKIDPGNLCHRCRKTTGQNAFINDDHFEAARGLIVEYSRLPKGGVLAPAAAERFGVHVDYLKMRRADQRLGELRRLVLARGCHQLLRFL